MKIIAASVLLFLLGPCATFAQVTLQIDSSTQVPSSLRAGASFSLGLDLNNQSSTGVAGYDVDVESFVLNLSTSTYVPVSNAFALTGVTLTNTALNLSNSTLPTSSSPVTLDPQAGSSAQPLDLGASNLFTNETVGTGTIPVETLSFQALSTAAPGSYKLEFFAIDGNAQGPVTISDEDGNSIGTASDPFTTDSFTVGSTPEPPAVILVGLAGLALCAGRFLRRRPAL